MKFDLLLVGRPSCDVIFTSLPQWPQLGQEIYAGGLTVVAGGSFNVAAAASRLGLRVGFIGVVGNDFWSQFVLRQFAAEGVSTELVRVLDRPLPTVSVALNHDGDRGFVTYDAEAEAVERELLSHALATLPACRARHAHLSLDPNLRELAAAARRSGATISADTWGHEPWLRSPAIWELAAIADLLFVNEAEALAMTGAPNADAALGRLREVSPYAVIKRGAAGSVAAVRNETFTVPTRPVPVVDATGAGDCFNAGFLYGWLRGLDPAACLTLGNLCGGRGVQAAGGYVSSPTEAELLELARARGLDLDRRAV